MHSRDSRAWSCCESSNTWWKEKERATIHQKIAVDECKKNHDSRREKDLPPVGCRSLLKNQCIESAEELMGKGGTKARQLLFWAQQSRIGNFGKGMKECSHDGSVPKKEQRADAGRERVGASSFLIMALRNGIVRQQTSQVGQFRAERKREGGRHAWRKFSRADAGRASLPVVMAEAEKVGDGMPKGDCSGKR